MILDSRNIEYEVIDIAEPAKEDLKDFMQNNATALGGTACDPKPRHALPPQIFNGDDYCGVCKNLLLVLDSHKNMCRHKSNGLSAINKCQGSNNTKLTVNDSSMTLFVSFIYFCGILMRL